MANHHVTVVRDFGDYKRGQSIEDDAEIERILGSELMHHVVKVHKRAVPQADKGPDGPVARETFPKPETSKE